MKRDNLTCLFILVDSRLPPQAIDLDFIEWAGGKNKPLGILFTKVDKLSRSELQKNVKRSEATLLTRWEELPTIILTSSEKKNGKQEVLALIAELIDEFET
jgi:GTP-binding protein